MVYAVGSPAGAETLPEALSSAYKFNPRLDAARATLRATDEEVPRALSGYRPSITGSADTSVRHITTNPGTIANGESNPRGYQVGMVQPLFRGFRTVNAVNAAEATVRAGRETLQAGRAERAAGGGHGLQRRGARFRRSCACARTTSRC